MNIYDDLNEKTAVIKTNKDSLEENDRSGRNFYLIEIYGEKLGRKIILDKEKTTIGRSIYNDIVIDSNSISRNHAIIIRKIDTKGKIYAYIRDLNSTNGIYLKDNKIPVEEDVELKDGVTIRIGRKIYKFLVGNDLESNYFEEIYRLTIIDALTEIYNKRAFLEALEKEFNRSKRYNRPLSIVMFDIDHFKNVNDTYGHLTGDYVLKHLSRIIKNSIRKEEFFARYGGEEFMIIMPESNLKSAIKLAEKIRILIQNTKFHFVGKIIPITISLGVAESNFDINEPFELLSIVDKKLYEAKANGRNCVVS